MSNHRDIDLVVRENLPGGNTATWYVTDQQIDRLNAVDLRTVRAALQIGASLEQAIEIAEGVAL